MTHHLRHTTLFTYLDYEGWFGVELDSGSRWYYPPESLVKVA